MADKVLFQLLINDKQDNYQEIMSFKYHKIAYTIKLAKNTAIVTFKRKSESIEKFKTYEISEQITKKVHLCYLMKYGELLKINKTSVSINNKEFEEINTYKINWVFNSFSGQLFEPEIFPNELIQLYLKNKFHM